MSATAAAVLIDEKPIAAPPGRETEFRRLQEAYDRSCQGRGRVVVIHGSVGSGRSELLHAFSGHAARSGALVLQAGGAPLEKSFSYGVVRQLFQSEDLPDDVAVAGLRLVDRSVPERPGAAVEVLEGLSALLLRLAERHPLVVAVDDRQDADRASLEFLVYLIRRTVRSRVLVLLSSRETMTPDHPTIEVELARQRHYERIRLELLVPGIVSARLAPVVDRAALDRLGGQAYHLTGGNPLLVSALIEDQTVGAVRLEAGENYRRAVMNCLHRIDPLALRCARGIAALGGGPAAPELLAELLLLRRDSLGRGLYLLEAAGLLADGGFRHPAVAGDLLAGVPADELAELQRRAARLLTAHGASAEVVAEARWAAAGHGEGRSVADDAEWSAAARTVRCVPGDRAASPAAPVALRDRRDVVAGGETAEEETEEASGTEPLRALLAGADPRVVVPQAEQVLREGRLGGLAPGSLGSALTALLYADRADRASYWTTLLADRNRERCGTEWGEILGAAQAETALRLGDPRQALERASALLAPAGSATSGTQARVTWLTTAIGAATALGWHDRARELLQEPTEEIPPLSTTGLRHLLARAEHLLETGRAGEARALFGEGGRTAARLGVDHLPGVGLWLVGAARAELGLGRRSAARRLAEEQLGRLGAAGSPRARGLALRVRAAAAEGAERVTSLEQALAQLERSGDVLTLDAVRAELAEACRAFGDPGRARTLERALKGESDRGRRRAAGTGHEVSWAPHARMAVDQAGLLSEAEQRVAELAAARLTNRDISRRLHVTVSTVEQHLTRVYRKLEVRSRAELRARLVGGQELAG